jgi:hypothetical protein
MKNIEMTPSINVDTQTDPETTTWASASTQTVPRSDKMASQTNNNPKHQYAVLQTEPPNDEPTQL